MKAYDRWGMYKPQSNDVSLLPTIGDPGNAEYPYVEQSENTDQYAAAWVLTSIDLPSGGTIEVDYESDDYAFVQDKKAMQMFQIDGTAIGGLANFSVDGKSNATLYDNGDYLYMSFPLNKPLLSGDEQINEYFYDYNGDLIENVYFNFLVENPTDKITTIIGSRYAYVAGYMQIEEQGLLINPEFMTDEGAYTHGYIKVKPATHGLDVIKKEIHPIAFADWNFLKLYQPKWAFGGSQPRESFSLFSIIESMEGLGDNLRASLAGFGNWMRLNKNGRSFVKSKSKIRLFHPDYAKKGGGLRVKKLQMVDNWKDMTGGQGSVYRNEKYGQVYHYEMEDQQKGTISSGVASYEPMIGGEENPFRQPVPYEEVRALIPNEKYFQEEPYGESMFPGPSVGYAKVTVENLKYETVSRHASGRVEHQFYTSRDFPTIVDRTNAEKVTDGPSITRNLLGITKDYLTASQGYSIELNNMHGM